MKTIELIVDDQTSFAYDVAGQEGKLKFQEEANKLLKRVLAEERTARIKKIVEEIKNDGNAGDLNPDILAELLREEI